MTTVLLTLGRLPKALDLARGFSRAGSRVIVADPFGWTLTGASRHVAREFAVPPPSKGSAEYLAALAEIVARESVDLVVPSQQGGICPRGDCDGSSRTRNLPTRRAGGEGAGIGPRCGRETGLFMLGTWCAHPESRRCPAGC